MRLLWLALILFICFAPAGSRLTEFKISGYAQGTTYHITYFANKKLFDTADADKILRSLDSSLSDYKPYSLVSRFNKGAKEIDMDEHLHHVVTRALTIWKETGAAFDITVSPLVKAWGFGPAASAGIPDSTDVKLQLKCVGSQQLRVNHHKLLKNKPCVQIDVNGIAQGYSVDVLATHLEKAGIHNYMVELGGEIRVHGTKPDGNSFQIGIESPPDNVFENGLPRKIVSLKSGALTTSGNYRKFYQSGNKQVSHLIDPGSGFPIQNELISVTVKAQDAITADGYDNALMVMGLHKALGFLKHHPEMAAYFIYRKPNGTVADTATKNF